MNMYYFSNQEKGNKIFNTIWEKKYQDLVSMIKGSKSIQLLLDPLKGANHSI